ncbi:trigger factor [Vallitalea pronyensis]|uniref:Trigger factor n=1 Tax=Vallitalea pronyensis TaxID=1348613 RepID=A0A8J8SFW2_9FIRM|nr:trigger factor [Vallitalea pronyensis]QUI21749.1 trigger factor [Vallitalea pronyensis]
MNVNVETLEKSMVKLTIEVDAERFEEGMKHAYNKNKGKITVPGFRKGKVPRQLIEKTYGAEIFYEDAANYIIPVAYDQAVEDNNLQVVSRPDVDVQQVEKGKAMIFTAEVAVKPEVTLGDYKGLEVEKVNVEVTDEDIQADIDKVREQNSRLVTITDRAVEDNDQVVIDFEGFVDGEPFEGGKGEDYPLTIGSHSFIDNFEEQLIGKNIDEELEVNVTFPEEYQSEALQGKPAMFKVKIKEIKFKELPEVDDEFAKDVSEFDTLDEYKADIKAKLLEQKEKTAKTEKQEAVLEKAIENATMEIADPMIDMQTENMTQDFAQRMQQQGLTLEQYFQFTGQNMATLKDSMKVEAEKRIKSRLVLEAIVGAEAIDVSDDELKEELEKMAKMYNMSYDELAEKMNDDYRDSIRDDIKNQKALDFIVEQAKEV